MFRGMKRSANLRKLLYCCLPVGLLILLQGLFGWDDPMTGAVYVDPEQDEKYLGSNTKLMAWSPLQRVAGFRNFDSVFTARKVGRGEHVHPLKTGDRPLAEVRYRVWNFTRHPVVVPLFEQFDLDDFILHNNIAGLLVIKSGEIVLERYAAGNSQQSRWVSMSVTKSIMSMLVGAAIADGAIQSVDDKATDYLPVLKGTSYEQTTIENLLQMSSGVEWNEDHSDQEPRILRYTFLEFAELLDLIGSRTRLSGPGEVFNYTDAEANVLGAVVAAAVDEDLATYLERKIWQPFGMESDANWVTFASGLQAGSCCISATLRDYGRLSLFAMRNGQLTDGTSVLPKKWMESSTTPSKSYDRYGYLWWLNDDGSYAAQGVFGQLIHVNPEDELVIATHSAWDNAVGDRYYTHQAAFVDAVTAALK